MATMGTSVPPKDFVPILRKNVPMEKPVIAAVNGLVIAGGLLMVQMCDLVVASRAATFAISEAKRGRGFPWAMPLAHLMPRRVLLEMLTTGEPISAQRAYDVGFINAVVEPEEVLSRARALAHVISANAPLTVKAALRMMEFADEAGTRAAEEMAEEIFKTVYLSEDAQEGPLAFKEKRPPVWKGR
jgi:enoyl-CoA hydratase/carnithine racemase